MTIALHLAWLISVVLLIIHFDFKFKKIDRMLDLHRDHLKIIETFLQGSKFDLFPEEDRPVQIQTLEGLMVGDWGDCWIIKGIKGEFYRCKPDIFEATYEAVE